MISDKKRFWKEFFWMNLATVMISVGVYCFKFPNNFSMGGVSGLSILLGKVLPVLSASSYNTIINVLFLILGFLMLLNPMSTLTAIRLFAGFYLILLGIDSVVTAFSPMGRGW